ncbi:hypothetical protein F4703DRAFT_1931053 [Phycomyces blakesleeanus]
MPPRSTSLSIHTPSHASLSQLSDKPSLKSPAPLTQELLSSRLKKTLFKKTFTKSFAPQTPSPLLDQLVMNSTRTNFATKRISSFVIDHDEDHKQCITSSAKDAIIAELRSSLALLKEAFDEVKESNKTLKSMLQALMNKDTVDPTSLIASKHAPKNITNSSSNNNNNNNKNSNSNGDTKTNSMSKQTYADKAKSTIAATVPKVLKQKLDILKAQTIRALQPTSGSSTYDFVYLSCKRFYKYNEVCKMMSILKISQSRILDIHFPARGVIGLSVHRDFKSELIDLLHKQKIVPIAHFSPLDGKIICDPKLALESLDVHASKAQELFDKRILCTCLHQPALEKSFKVI